MIYNIDPVEGGLRFMAYIPFFYSYFITIATAVTLFGFLALNIRKPRRLHALCAVLFALYLVDITMLWMVDYIPDFKALFDYNQTEVRAMYSLFNTCMVFAYRGIVGDLLDCPISTREGMIWILCLAGILTEGAVKSDWYSFAVELVVPYALRVWSVCLALFIYIRQRGLVERGRRISALCFIMVYILMELAEFTLPNTGARRIPFEIMGFIYTAAGMVYLYLQLKANDQALKAMNYHGFAQAHDLTRREEEICLLVLQGRTNREIAEELHVSIGTVKTHVRHIFEKAGVATREDLRDKAQAQTQQ